MQCLTWNVTWIDEGLWTFFCQIMFWIVTLSFSCFQTHSQLCRVTSFKLATVPVVKVNSSLYQNKLYLLLNHMENALKFGACSSITKQNWDEMIVAILSLAFLLFILYYNVKWWNLVLKILPTYLYSLCKYIYYIYK